MTHPEWANELKDNSPRIVYLIPKYQDTMRFDLIVADIWTCLTQVAKIKRESHNSIKTTLEAEVYRAFLRNYNTCSFTIDANQCKNNDGLICLIKLPKQPPGIDKFKPQQNPKLPTLVNV